MKLNAAKYVQLIPEGLLFYFIMLPVFVYQHDTLPLWRYISLVILTVLLTDIGRQLTQRFIIYLPILGIIYAMGTFVFSYPVLVPLLLGVFLFWREERFVQDGRSEQPLLLVALSAGLVLIEMFFLRNTTLIWMGLIQFMTIAIGQWLLFLFSYATLKQHMRKPFIGSASTVIGGGVLLYFLFPLISQSLNLLLSGVGWGIQTVGYGVTRLFGLENMELPSLQPDRQDDAFEKETGNFELDKMDQFKTDPSEESEAALNSTDFLNIWTILGLVLILIVTSFIFYRKKRKKTVPVTAGSSQQAAFSSTTLDDDQVSHDTKQRKTDSTTPTAPQNPVREHVFQFEGDALNKGYGRKSGETVEEWLLRLGFDASELNMYQKVRYGNQSLTDREYHQFEQRLNHLQKRLKQL